MHRHENRSQVAVEDARIPNGNSFVVLIVLGHRVAHCRNGQILVRRLGDLWNLLGDRAHGPVHVLEFYQRAPALVRLPPIETGRQPNGKRLGEIFVGMFLRVPPQNVTHEIARERIRAVPLTVGTGIWPEHLSPFRSVVQAVSIVERVPRLVPQVPHRFLRAFDGGGIVFFDFGKSSVGEIKRDADQGRPIRTSPLIAEIDRRPKLERLRGELLVELVDQLLEQRSTNLQSDIGDPLRQERMTLAFPTGRSFFHSPQKGQAPYRAQSRRGASIWSQCRGLKAADCGLKAADCVTNGTAHR